MCILLSRIQIYGLGTKRGRKEDSLHNVGKFPCTYEVYALECEKRMNLVPLSSQFPHTFCSVIFIFKEKVHIFSDLKVVLTTVYAILPYVLTLEANPHKMQPDCTRKPLTTHM